MWALVSKKTLFGLFMTMTEIEVLILAGASPSSVAVTLEVLATANRLAAGRTGGPPFRAWTSGSGAEAWSAVLDVAAPAERPDLLIVPGLALTTAEAIEGRLHDPDMHAAAARLVWARDAGIEVATSCSGAFLLAQAGLLAGRRATTSWWLAPLLARMHPDIELTMDELIVRDGGVTTAGAAMAQMDLMLSLVARLAGASLAARCSRYLLMDERRSQSRYMALSYLAAADDQVARAEAWARGRLDQDLKVADLAAAAGLAPRTFARRVEQAAGLSPIRFLQRMRIEAATDLIETTRLSVEEIARRVGYADPSALRRIMQREGGRQPSHVRRASA